MHALSESQLATPEKALRLLAYAKGNGAKEERYIFKYTDEMKGEMVRFFGDCARNAEWDSFTGYDAAVLSMRARHLDDNDRNRKQIEEMRIVLLRKLQRRIGVPVS